VSTLVLVRHGLTQLTGSVLAGRAPGTHLDERGTTQAEAVAQRLAALPLTAIVTSPLERCVETAEHIRTAQRAAGHDPQWHLDDGLIECGYGAWTGQKLAELVKEPLWRTVQVQPSAARFPDGESLTEMSARAVASVRGWSERLGPDAIWLACSHGDVIKSIVADALGLHLDQFQRISIDPASVTVIRYTDTRPYVLRCNDSGGDLSGVIPPKKDENASGDADSDATVGGGAGGGQV
jgi:probable phosphomutase (TIGR03848 family)